MMTKEKAAELGYKPLAQWICGADYGVDPRIMGIAPSFFSFKWQKAKSTMKN
jgi:acetyl-CoA C-acetyltransferase